MLLAEAQAAIRAAMLAGGSAPEATPPHRIAIHRRHYRASLMTALATKFPATLWLLGSARFNALAGGYLAALPPTSPCIAEYGERFPEFAAAQPLGAELPYLAAVARADWLLGQVSIAISSAPLPVSALSGIAAERLPEIRLTLQPGLRFLESDWPVDKLIALHLGGDPPVRFVFEPEPVALQFRGARGAFSIDRLDTATLAFRRAAAGGATLGEAAERGLAARSDFDPGTAFAAIFAAGLVVRATASEGGHP